MALGNRVPRESKSRPLVSGYLEYCIILAKNFLAGLEGILALKKTLPSKIGGTEIGLKPYFPAIRHIVSEIHRSGAAGPDNVN